MPCNLNAAARGGHGAESNHDERVSLPEQSLATRKAQSSQCGTRKAEDRKRGVADAMMRGALLGSEEGALGPELEGVRRDSESLAGSRARAESPEPWAHPPSGSAVTVSSGWGPRTRRRGVRGLGGCGLSEKGVTFGLGHTQGRVGDHSAPT